MRYKILQENFCVTHFLEFQESFIHGHNIYVLLFKGCRVLLTYREGISE